MFATQANNKKTASAELKTRRADSAPNGQTSPETNALWQSLALGSFRIQAKLAVSQPDDPDEREADHIADKVMRMATPQIADSTVSSPESLKVQRKCAPCKEEEEKEKVQRKQRPANGDSPAPGLIAQSLNSTGEPLDPATRAFMEPHFGYDFGQVRVHSGFQATAAANAINATAYTLGSDIVFGAGEYSPATAAGKRLLAHELTHVVQQGQAGAPAEKIQRSPRTLPARVGQSNFLLAGGGNEKDARTTHFSAVVGLSGNVSAIAGEGMTLRGLARMLLPTYARAATAAGAAAAPTEDELAKAILDYNRFVLGPPAMSEFRAGMRLRLPVELDPGPGPVSHTRNDWLIDPDAVRAHAAVVTVAEAPLVDRPAPGAAAPPTAGDVTTFTTAVAGAAPRGMALHGSVLANPFKGAPLATMVLAGMNATDRFDASMAFMSSVTNPEVTMLETLAPGFTLLQTLRSALTAPPAGLPAATETMRVSRVGMLPQDPAIAGLSPDFLSSTGPGGALDRPNVIFFRRGRSSIDASETAKIPALRATNPGPVTLIGFTSEEEDPSLATARTRAVETILRTGSVIVDTQRAAATNAAGARPSIGSLAYAEMRSVRVDAAPPAFEPDCHAVASTHEACTPNHAALDSRFQAAHVRAKDIVEHAQVRMAAGRDPARDAAIRRRFGVASHARLLTRLNMLHGTIVAALNSYECGTTCDASCNSGALAYSGGPGASPLMVVCDGVLSADLEYGASVIIHESCHATQGMLQANPAAAGHPADWAYRWERMSGTITEMSPNPRVSNASLDNADSYTQFVMDLRDPVSIPAGSQPMDEAPTDDFQGVWTTAHRNLVRHGLANCQKWFIWGGSYLANAYDHARRGTANPTYGFASNRFAGFAAVPGDADRARLAGIQSTVRTVGSRMSLAMRIEHAAAGNLTSFGAARPLLLLVGTDALGIGSDRTRGELFVRRLIEAAPEIDAARHAAYSGLIIDIRNQYELDH